MEDNMENGVEETQEAATLLEGEVENTEESATTEEIDHVEEDSDSDSEHEQKQDSTPKGIKKKFGKLTKEREAARQEAEFWKAEALKGARPQTQQVQAATDSKPQLADFGYDVEAYTEALTDWKVEQKVTAKLEAQAKQSQLKTIVDNFDSRGREFQKQFPDYEEAVMDAFAGKPLDHDSAAVIQESELGPEIAYYLAQNEDVLSKLRSLPVAKRLVEIGRIETKLSDKGSSSNGASTASKTTKVPPTPIKPVKGALSAGAAKRPEEMSFTEFEQYEREQWAKKNK